MRRPAKRPTTWAEIEAALAKAEVNGAERALRMAGTPFPGQERASISRREFERAIAILQGEADDYVESARLEAERKAANS